MNRQFDLLVAEALKLNARERTMLAEHLLASLADEAESEMAWADEVKQRMALQESGQVVALPFEEAMAEIYAAIK
jgi:putative addiction module component (TIGR02574 family)